MKYSIVLMFGFYLAILLVAGFLFSGCCKLKEGSTRDQAISYKLIHPFESDNPHCE